jgi:hypothetical protein
VKSSNHDISEDVKEDINLPPVLVINKKCGAMLHDIRNIFSVRDAYASFGALSDSDPETGSEPGGGVWFGFATNRSLPS